MTKYEVSYRDTLLGHLYIQNGQHCYIPIAQAVEEIRRKAPLPWEMVQGYPWGKPIPFFQERIESAKRFGMEAYICRQTDYFVMKMV